MKPYLVKTPRLVQWIYPRRVWAFSAKTPNVYLTFDDGPIPEVTPWVLEVLRKYDAKATFFCIGDNIRKHPEIFKQMATQGHTFGNHTYHHLKGNKTPTEAYLNNIKKCSEEMLAHAPGNTSKLFRPPYGKLTSKQAQKISDKGYKIVMWNVLSADFDTNISEEKCLQNVLKNISPGSIVVFHDSLKAEKNLRCALPKVLEFVTKKGWNCAAIRV